MLRDRLVSEKKKKNYIAENVLASFSLACSMDFAKTQLGLLEALLAIFVGKFMIRDFNTVH
jgi:hypothetical protein